MGIYHSIPLSCIIPSTGYIRIREILMTIDQCIDNVLSSLRPSMSDYRIDAIGFSTFVMNLIGVDENGEPVGGTATCSYACNRKDVVEECQKLKQ
jgi:sugar (pentulose or hexulose) kinase